MFIDCVKNGVECIEQIEKQPADYYSLILMNIQMPILDGYYTTQKIIVLYAYFVKNAI